jgi:zinc/manganese transport system substrate-binding protein
MVENICGDDVKVDTLMVGPENHHAVPLKPSFLTKLSRCQILVLNGLEYEHAFLPGALMGISNPNIQRGGPGYIDTSEYIRPCEVPSKIDLALGDLHPLGASHIHTDPRNAILQCKAIYEGMAKNFPGYAEKWRPGYEAYVRKIYAKMQELKQYAKGTEGLKLVFYHPGWCYLANTFKWDIPCYVEVRAGIPPTPSHIQELISLVTGQKEVHF